MRDLSELVIGLEGLKRHPVRLHGEIPVAALTELGVLAQVTQAARADLTAQRHGDNLRVRGEVSGSAGLTCSRCLAPFEITLTLAADRLYSAREVPQGRELELEDDTVCLEDGLFSVKRMVEEELILALPMIPLCRDGCRGLCAQCGADLNRGGCACAEEIPSGPFAALGALKNKD